MPLRGRAKLKGSNDIGDFDYYGWWKSLVNKGIQPSEAWQMDFLESSVLFDLEPQTNDNTLAIHMQRVSNGMPQ